jgi:5-methylcytosine-specific restriction endonuclease McrA
MKPLRQCKCGTVAYTEEQLDLFVSGKKCKYGRFNNCKKCSNEKSKEWKKKNPEKRAEVLHNYYLKNKEKTYENSKKWRENNPEKARASAKKSRERNKERYKPQKAIHDRESREKNKEALRLKKQKYYNDNKERIRRESKEKYEEKKLQLNAMRREKYEQEKDEINRLKRIQYNRDEAVREKRLMDNRARRNLKYGAEGIHTNAQFWSVCDKQKWTCVYCGSVLSQETATEDHIIPLIRGGSDWIENIQAACKGCNSRKHAKTHEEFIKLLEAEKGVRDVEANNFVGVGVNQ